MTAALRPLDDESPVAEIVEVIVASREAGYVVGPGLLDRLVEAWNREHPA